VSDNLNDRSQKRNDNNNKYQRQFSQEDCTLTNEFNAAATTDYSQQDAAAAAGTKLHPAAFHHRV